MRWIALRQQGDRTSTALSAAAPSLDTSASGRDDSDHRDAARPVTGGVDTHLDLNVAAALDAIGGLLSVAEFPATSAGHRDLLGWLSAFGPVARVGVEGTGSYGATMSPSAATRCPPMKNSGRRAARGERVPPGGD